MNSINIVDKVESFEGSKIQHGKSNDRIYLQKEGNNISLSFVENLISFGRDKKYSKIFAKVKDRNKSFYLEKGFSEEGAIPLFFNGIEDVSFLVFYLDSKRSVETDIEQHSLILDLALSKNNSIGVTKNDIEVSLCSENDASEMTSIYKEVFRSYPFPIFDPKYIVKTMNENIEYYGIKILNKLTAVASSEMDLENKNVEMTDFATLPDFRSQNYASIILNKMEKEMSAKGIKTFYSIARALSPGMNITFSKSGYKYGGRLINNTNINGKIESMNIWYKNL